jgi:hypothetical protein
MFIPGLALGSSALLKFSRAPGVVHQMAASGFAVDQLTLVATLELHSVVLFLDPRTRSVGLLALSSFLGGTICTHVQLGEYSKARGPFILSCLAWIGTWLRHSEGLWSLNLHREDPNHLTESKSGGWASRGA